MIISAAIIVATVAAVLSVYLGARQVLNADPDERTRDLASSILFRISALHGLVLALVFASEVVEYHQLGLEIAAEANAVSDIYYDASRYGEDADGIRAALRDYVKVVPSEEWDSLGDETDLSENAWQLWGAAYDLILDLTPASPKETALRDNMLEKIHLISERRDLREHHAKSKLTSVFWLAALVGVLLISVGYYANPPIRDNLILISIFAAYTGFILFTIYAMSNPFSPPVALKPVLFIELHTELGS